MSRKSQHLAIINYKISIQEITKGHVCHGLRSISMKQQEETSEQVTESATQITSNRRMFPLKGQLNLQVLR